MASLFSGYARIGLLLAADSDAVEQAAQAPAMSFTTISLIFLIAMVAVLFVCWLMGRVPLSYNLRNMTVRWRTTLMTALACTLVVGLMTVMLAFVSGMRQLTEASGRPRNVMVLSEGSLDEVFSRLDVTEASDIENQPGVTRKGLVPMCSRETYLIVNQPRTIVVPGGPKRRFTQVRGIEDPEISLEVHGLELYGGGRVFSQAGVRQSETAGNNVSLIEVVIGEGVARELGRDRMPEDLQAARNPASLEPGDTFPLGARRCLVVGVMQSGGTTFDSEIWAKRGIVGPLFGKEWYTTLVLQAADAEGANKLAKYYAKDYSKANLNGITQMAYFASLQGTNQQFLYVIIVIAIIMAIGGVMGTMNTMFAAISQRIKDIGVMRLLGYPRWQILTSFLLESVLIALIGGLIGLALGSLCHGTTATSVAGAGPGGGKTIVLKLTVDGTTVLYGVILSLLMGGIGGLFPSLRAMWMKPLESLR